MRRQTSEKMKKNKKTPSSEGGLIHLATALLFIALAAFVGLGATGYIRLRLPGDAGTAERTKTPGELAYESYLAELEPSPETTKNATTAPLTAETTGSKVPADQPQYPTLAELTSLGYKLTYEDLTTDMQFALISLDDTDISSFSLYSGRKKTVSVMTPKTLEDGGIPYESYTEKRVNRMTIETYMGYFILDDNDEGKIFTSMGSPIATFDGDAPTPAYTRDSDGHPLWILDDGSYFYFDENGAAVTADYDSQNDSRGLLFDYAPNFGTNSNTSLNVCWQTEAVTLDYSLDRDNYYTRYAVDPRLARVLYETDPVFAERVAVRQQSGNYYNYPFKLALDRAKEEIAREAADAITAELTTNVVSPDEPTPISADALPYQVVSLSPEELSGEITTAPQSTESAPETSVDISLDTATEDITTTGPNEITPAVDETTEAPYDPIVNISVTFDSPRYYFGTTPETAELGGYARAYSFSEGYACIVDDYGVLKVINKNGRVTARLRHEYRTDAANGYTYMVRTYYKPLYNDIYSLGYYYFDHGLMRVRVIEHEMIEGDVVNHVTADYDILIDPWGNEFDIPSGYKLVSYSDGVILLERDGRYGYYHIDGHWIAQPVYSYAMPFVEGIGVLGTSDGDMGAVDTSGNIVIPFEYEYISTPSSGVISCFSTTAGWTLLAKTTRQ